MATRAKPGRSTRRRSAKRTIIARFDGEAGGRLSRGRACRAEPSARQGKRPSLRLGYAALRAVGSPPTPARCAPSPTRRRRALLQCADVRHCSAQRVRPTHRRPPARVGGAARAAEDRGSRPLLLGAAAHPRPRAGPVGCLPARRRWPQLDLSPVWALRRFRAVRAVDRAVDRQPRPAVLRRERARRVGGRRAGWRPRRRRSLPENHAGHGRHRGGPHPLLAPVAAHSGGDRGDVPDDAPGVRTRYRRYEWKCDVLNAPSRRAAQRLGFSYEGIFRQAIVTKGRNRDTAWYACIDQEWPALDAAYQHWLAPSNFDRGEGGSASRCRHCPTRFSSRADSGRWRRATV